MNRQHLVVLGAVVAVASLSAPSGLSGQVRLLPAKRVLRERARTTSTSRPSREPVRTLHRRPVNAGIRTLSSTLHLPSAGSWKETTTSTPRPVRSSPNADTAPKSIATGRRTRTSNLPNVSRMSSNGSGSSRTTRSSTTTPLTRTIGTTPDTDKSPQRTSVGTPIYSNRTPGWPPIRRRITESELSRTG